MRNYYRLFLLVMLMIISASQVFAQIKNGEATVIQGSTTTVAIGSAYQSTLNRATGINYTWTAGSSAISIQSRTNKTCTIKGNTPGTAKLYYKCSYYIDGFYRTMDFYYDITIKSNTISVTRLEVTPTAATLNVGETIKIGVTVYPTNATNKQLIWDSLNPNVATVNNNGVIEAVGAGSTSILVAPAENPDYQYWVSIKVNSPTKVSSIELSKTEATMGVGEELMLKASILPDNAYNKDIKWASDNAGVAKVANGIITAITPGECNITCTSTDGSNVSAKCHIIVNEPEQHWISMVLPNGSFAINVTDLEAIELKITPETGYLVHSVTVDGIEQKIVPTETVLVLPKLTHNASVNAVFVSSDPSKVNEYISDASNQLQLTVSGKTIFVDGLQYGETVNVYTINGESVLSTSNSSFILSHSGVYMVQIGTRSFKIAI